MTQPPMAGSESKVAEIRVLKKKTTLKDRIERGSEFNVNRVGTIATLSKDQILKYSICMLMGRYLLRKDHQPCTPGTSIDASVFCTCTLLWKISDP